MQVCFYDETITLPYWKDRSYKTETIIVTYFFPQDIEKSLNYRIVITIA